ncbi:MAG: NAD-dependent epimerase/dehydratase family protein [Betaproteobacteria bacterium]|nr:NAD-dependent epimerase/dehydratase family protein [Betaproteobacteria bacterium]
MRRDQRYDLSNHMVWARDGKPGGMGRFTPQLGAEVEDAYRQAPDPLRPLRHAGGGVEEGRKATKVLVTGVGGFIGAHVANRFLADGHAVVGADDFSSGYRENVPPGVELVEGDLAEPRTIVALPRDCELILHLAGQSSGEISFDDPVSDLRKNTVSTLNLIRYSIECGAARFVYASSMSCYGSVPDAPIAEATTCLPLSCYGVGKLAAEGYLRAREANALVALRMFNVYGPGQDLEQPAPGDGQHLSRAGPDFGPRAGQGATSTVFATSSTSTTWLRPGVRQPSAPKRWGGHQCGQRPAHYRAGIA